MYNYGNEKRGVINMKKKIIKKTKGLWSEFKAFISKGSVLDPSLEDSTSFF